MDPRLIAEFLQSLGQRGDTILAHINPREAALLKAHGGSGRRNPHTGLLSFDPDGPDGNGYGGMENGAGSEYSGGLEGYSGDPNATMSLADQYAAYGGGRRAAEQTAGYGYGATQNWLGDLMGRFNALSPSARVGVSMAPGVGAAAALGNLAVNNGLGTNTNGARGITESASANYQGTAGPNVFGGRDAGQRGWEDDLWGNGRQSSYIGTNR